MKTQRIKLREKDYKAGFYCCSRFFDIRFADKDMLDKFWNEYKKSLTSQSEIPTEQPTKESINDWLLKNHPLTPVAPIRMLDSDEFRRVVTDYIFEFITGIQSEESLKIQSDFNKVAHTLDYLIEEKKQQSK